MGRPAAQEAQSQMTILVPMRIKHWLVAKAAENDRSLNKEVARILSRAMTRREAVEPDT